jgi:ABC-type cobalt transport system substrate-binding protein
LNFDVLNHFLNKNCLESNGGYVPWFFKNIFNPYKGTLNSILFNYLNKKLIY